MNLIGATAHSVELAETLAMLLQRHGYTQPDAQPKDLDELLTQARKAKAAPADVYVLIQEGGSSSELYVHSHDTLEDANADRESSASGAYRTSPAFQVSGALAQTPGFYEALAAALDATNNLDLVDAPVED